MIESLVSTRLSAARHHCARPDTGRRDQSPKRRDCWAASLGRRGFTTRSRTARAGMLLYDLLSLVPRRIRRNPNCRPQGKAVMTCCQPATGLMPSRHQLRLSLPGLAAIALRSFAAGRPIAVMHRICGKRKTGFPKCRFLHAPLNYCLLLPVPSASILRPMSALLPAGPRRHHAAVLSSPASSPSWPELSLRVLRHGASSRPVLPSCRGLAIVMPGRPVRSASARGAHRVMMALAAIAFVHRLSWRTLPGQHHPAADRYSAPNGRPEFAAVEHGAAKDSRRVDILCA